MSVTNGLTKGDGIFPSIAELQESLVNINHTVAVNDGSSIQWYKIETTDSGSAVELDSGLFANPTSTLYDNTISGLIATEVQAAIDELKAEIDSMSSSYVTKFASGVIEIPSGTVSDIVLPTPPSGQRVVLTSLGAITTTQSNITTVDVGGVDVTSGNLRVLSQTPTLSGQLLVGGGGGNHTEIIGDIDEVVTIKTDVNTSSAGGYSYQFQAPGA